ncbi:MAG: glycine--tRNA ligase [Candidatus Saccharibacteria bacterium]|nr:glycine--tRNA ligase [Candidatus Saccharibacteria bacterium]MCY4010715.1 glycine--tRNA ligase [Candidatus Saccharibacteria bacterium]
MLDIKLEDIVSLCKRRGFLYQGSEIYGGLSGTWDLGPLGVQLKRNILQSWWQTFVEKRSDIYGLDSAILMNPQVWQASGHLEGFVDPIVKDQVTKIDYRADHLLEDQGFEVEGLNLKELQSLIDDNQIKSPDSNPLSRLNQFNLMFQTRIGAQDERAQTVYLRPETAQGIFVNFKNLIDSFQPDLPFGIAQIGKAFRNEISPRDFVFRSREFEMLEIEYFCPPAQWQTIFDQIKIDLNDWLVSLGISLDSLTELEVPESERAHYSQRTIDMQFAFPFGEKELYGLAYRGDYDLRQHQDLSGKSLEYIDKKTQSKFLPVCIEPSIGVERLLLAVLQSAYKVDKENKRVYLALPAGLAPIKYAVSPLVNNKADLITKALTIFKNLQAKYGCVVWDDHGNIGKRYRRQDEVGTPACIVIDFQTLEDDTVTVRSRDDLQQKRLKISAL